MMETPRLSELAQRRCRPCEGNVPPLEMAQVQAYLRELGQTWQCSEDGKRIRRSFRFRNYYQTTAFVNAVVWVAHQEDHHPDILFGYNQAEVSYTTHAIGGLSENDFICAVKIDALLSRRAD